MVWHVDNLNCATLQSEGGSVDLHASLEFFYDDTQGPRAGLTFLLCASRSFAVW